MYYPPTFLCQVVMIDTTLSLLHFLYMFRSTNILLVKLFWNPSNHSSNPVFFAPSTFLASRIPKEKFIACYATDLNAALNP